MLTTVFIGSLSLGLLYGFPDKYVYASDTTYQVNRADKSGRLSKSQLGPASTQTHLKTRLPKTKGTAAHLEEIEKNKQRNAQSRKAPAVQTPQLVNNVSIKVGLSKFYAALDGLLSGARTRPVTILHLGNDRIARDRFSGDLRQMLQNRFGNAGRGMIMPGQAFSFYRAREISISQNGKWRVSSALDRDAANGQFGLTGVSLSSADANAKITIQSKDKNFSWVEMAFLTGPEQGRAVLTVDTGQAVEKQIIETQANSKQMQRVRFPAAAKSASLQPERAGKPITLLSWRTGHDVPGIRYVNLGLPDATINIAQNLNANFVKNDLEVLQPDLVILTYGSNEAYKLHLDADAFEKQSAQLIQALSHFAPDASFLITGPADMSDKPRVSQRISPSSPCRALSEMERADFKNLVKQSDQRLARWYPPLNLRPIRSALQRAAAQTNAYFWDWSKVMGGACGIHAWVHASPKLAADDHRSLTDAGARVSAEALFSEIMSGFEAYRLVASR